ncbi:MAG: hypothetical protein ACYDC6_14875 [Acidobacteriaceae bacterium]
MAIRSALHQAGATARSELLQFAPPAPEQRRLPCSRGHTANYLELRVNTELSPGVRRMLAVVGAAAPFQQGREQMKVLAGLEVTAKSVERTARRGEPSEKISLGASERKCSKPSHWICPLLPASQGRRCSLQKRR